MNDKLYKALESVALGFSEGSVSADMLIKACDTYKAKTEFEDDFNYQILVAKSLFDSLNGVKPDEEISKAIVPGQTKVVDGIMYIYSPTAPGSNQPYDWHVVKKGAKTQKNIGRGNKLDAKKVDDKQKFVNSLFPKDLSSLTTVNASIGGSTGAKLVQDVNGNQYIMKKGTNTSNGHVKSEYLTNQLYDILGQRVPDYELYDDNGTAVILSKFIPMCKQPTHKNYADMAKGFITDVLLANWDVYQNDNCLIDAAGRVIRVDNGGALEYKARGGSKTFDGNVLKTFNDMVAYNPSVYATLSEADVLKQIAAVRSKKDDIVNFLKESGQDALAKTIGERIDNLKKIEDQFSFGKGLLNMPIKARKLKSDDEMYREFDDQELEDLWNNAQGKNASGKLFNIGNLGWSMISDIAKLRGFDARPEVVTEAEYWKRIGKDSSRQFFRGISEDWRGKHTLDEMAKSMLFDDDCFYGAIGAYGAGIYAHRNDGTIKNVTSTDYKKSSAYDHAKNYAQQNGKGFIFKGALAADAKIASYDVLSKELSKLTVSSNPTKVASAQKALDKLDKEILAIDDKINNAAKIIEDQVYADMHYDPVSYADQTLEIDNTDWGKKDAFGERDIPSFDDFVVGKMADWVRAQGGTATAGKGTMKFTLPNGDTELSISKYQYDGPFSIKQKNAWTPAHNFAVDKFVDWMNAEHVSKVQRAVNDAKTLAGDMVSKLQDERKAKISDRQKKADELKNLQNVDPNSGIWAAVCDMKGRSETLGIYAALKGYDAIECKNGNGHSNSFYVILNRSKLIISNQIDNV